MLLIIALWTTALSLALMLVSGIGAAAAAADRNSQRLVRDRRRRPVTQTVPTVGSE